MTDPIATTTNPSPRQTLAMPAGDGASRAAISRSTRFSATLRSLGSESTTILGAWNPGSAGPAVGAGSGVLGTASETPAAAQASREQAQKPRDSERGKESGEGRCGEGKGSSADGSGPAADANGAATGLPDRPLSIRSLNDLLLTADPAVVALRNGAGLAKPATDTAAPSPDAEHEGTTVRGRDMGRPPDARADTAPNDGRRTQTLTTQSAATNAEHASAEEAGHEPAAKQGVPAASQDQPAPHKGPESTAKQPAATGNVATPALVVAAAPQLPGPDAAEAPSDTTGRISGVQSAESAPAGSRPFQIRTAPATTAAPAALEDQERLAALVSRGLAAAISQQPDSESGQREVVLRLQPESLGQLRVQVGMEGESVTARFEAATAEARDLLDRSMASLRSSLEARGLHVEKLHVQLAPSIQVAAAEPANAGNNASSGSTGGGSSLAYPAWNAGDSIGNRGGETAADGGGYRGSAGREAEHLAEAMRSIGPRGETRYQGGPGTGVSWEAGAQGGAAASVLAGIGGGARRGGSWIGAEPLVLGIDTVA